MIYGIELCVFTKNVLNVAQATAIIIIACLWQKSILKFKETNEKMEVTYFKVGIMIISIGFNDCVELNIVCNIIYHGFVSISNSSQIIFSCIQRNLTFCCILCILLNLKVINKKVKTRKKWKYKINTLCFCQLIMFVWLQRISDFISFCHT